MKILNLYAGIGGNRAAWPQDAKVTAVEKNPEIAKVYASLYPDDQLIIGDAHDYLLKHYAEFDFIWSSPPCQTHSKLNKATRHDLKRYPDMKLYQEIILLKHNFKGLWVVENVQPYYEPLIKPQEAGRHLFWANFTITSKEIQSPPDFSRANKEVMFKWLGFRFEGNIYLDGNHDPAQVLRNCVHPSLGLHVFKCAFKEKQEVLI